MDTNDAQRRYEENRKVSHAERELQMNIDLQRVMTRYCDDYHRLRINQAYKWDAEKMRHDEQMTSEITGHDLLIADIGLILGMIVDMPSRELILISADLMETAAKEVGRLALQTMFGKAVALRCTEYLKTSREPINDNETLSLCNGVFMPSLQPIAAEIEMMSKRARQAATPENGDNPFIFAELTHALDCTRWTLQVAFTLHSGYDNILKEYGPDEDEIGRKNSQTLKTTWETPENCPHCGEHLSLDWGFCPECGRPTDWSKDDKEAEKESSTTGETGGLT